MAISISVTSHDDKGSSIDSMYETRTLAARRPAKEFRHVMPSEMPEGADAASDAPGKPAPARAVPDRSGDLRHSAPPGIALKCARLLDGALSLRFLADRVVAELNVPLVAVDGDVPALPAGLRVASLDDDPVIRMLDVRLFAKLGFDACVRGANEEEIRSFPSFVAGLKPPPLLVFIDQNLDHPIDGSPCVKGTDLVAPLRASFAGKIVIKSANQSSEDRAHYEASGADAAIDKALMGEALKRELAEILAGTWAWNSGSIDMRVLGALEADVAAEHIHLFLQRAPALAQAVGARLEGDNGAHAWGAVHRLKALAGFVGARALVEACEALRGVDAYHGDEESATELNAPVWIAKLARLHDATQDALAALTTLTEANKAAA